MPNARGVNRQIFARTQILAKRGEDQDIGTSASTFNGKPRDETSTQDKDKDSRGHIYLASAILKPSVKDIVIKSRGLWPLLATKIGYVKGGLEGVKKRKSTLQTGIPFPLEMVTFPCKKALNAERIWHKYFKSKRIPGGEWFHLLDEDKNLVAKEMDTYDKSGLLMGRKVQPDSLSRKSNAKTTVERTKNEVSQKDEVKSILRKHVGLLQNDNIEAERSYLEEDELDLLIEVLGRHPESEKKIGCGVKDIFVSATSMWDRHTSNYSYCFHVKRMDDSEEDFSYHACFGRYRSMGPHYTHTYSKD